MPDRGHFSRVLNLCQHASSTADLHHLELPNIRTKALTKWNESAAVIDRKRLRNHCWHGPVEPHVKYGWAHLLPFLAARDFTAESKNDQAGATPMELRQPRQVCGMFEALSVWPHVSHQRFFCLYLFPPFPVFIYTFFHVSRSNAGMMPVILRFSGVSLELHTFWTVPAAAARVNHSGPSQMVLLPDSRMRAAAGSHVGFACSAALVPPVNVCTQTGDVKTLFWQS